MIPFLLSSLQWIGGIILVGIIAEFLARFWLRRIVRPTMYLPRTRMLISIHDQLRTYLPDEVVYAINSEGERGSEPPLGPGVHRVLLFGASNAECRVLAQDRSLGGALETALNEPEIKRSLQAERVHVGVVAQSGLDAAAVYTLMRHTLPHYRGLDTILILCGLSDVMRWLEFEAPSGRIPPPVPLDELLVAHPEMKFSLARPAVLKALKRLWTTWVARDIRQESVGKYAVRERDARRGVKNFLTVESDPSAVVNSFKTNMKKAVELARQHARQVVVVRQYWLDKDEFPPEEDHLLWGGRFGNPRTPGPPRFVNHAQLLALFRLIDRAAEEVARECGVPNVGFFEYPEQKFGIYYDDFHYTHEGARQAAQVIARSVAEHAQTAKV